MSRAISVTPTLRLPQAVTAMMQPEHVLDIAILHVIFDLCRRDRLVARITRLTPPVSGVGLRGRRFEECRAAAESFPQSTQRHRPPPWIRR
jgi:hypothetical protein